MSATTKISPSQLATLEQAFANGPSSDAWRPLAEAYLATGRHLEATVVSKKAARQRPTDPAPRVLLARVLMAQGRAQKAMDEIAQALQLRPGDVDALAVARDLGRVNGAVAPAPAATSPAPDRAGSTASGGGAAGHPGAAASPEPEGSRSRRRGSPPQLDASWSLDLARRFGADTDAEPRARRSRARRDLLRTVALAASLAAVLGVAATIASSRRERAAEVERLLSEARPLLDRDTWDASRAATDRCERALALDAGAAEARACAAWAAAIRWIDHGEGDAVRDAAKRHLAALGASSAAPRAVAAAAVLRAGEGDSRGAAETIRARVAADPDRAILQSALGEALLVAGDLEGARAALGAAQRLNPGDVRTLRLLAEQFRRRGGNDLAQAEILYEIALGKLAPDHHGALLGKARLLVDRRAHAEALAVADRVAAAGDAASPRQRAVALALRSRAQLLAGRKDEARAAEDAARALDPSGREVREILTAPLAAQR